MTLTQITEKGIKDGEIVNADISSNTNDRIAGSKIDPSFTSNIHITNDAPKLFLTDASNNPDFSLQNANGAFVVFDDTNSASRLEIDVNGNVGIGTSSPIEKLQSTGAIISTGSNSTGSTTGANRSIIDLTSGGTRIGHFRGSTSAGSGSLKFFVDSSEMMQIDSDGKVGIGTTSPINIIHATGSTTQAGYQFINTHSTDGYGVFISGGGTSSGRYALRVDNAADNELFRILSNGNVGIGTSSPDRLIHAAGATPILKLDSTNNEAYVQLVTASPSNTFYLGLVDSDIILQSSGASSTTSENLRIKANGRVGIGTASPSGTLSIADPNGDNVTLVLHTSATTNYIQLSDSVNAHTYIGKENSGNLSQVAFYASTSTGNGTGKVAHFDYRGLVLRPGTGVIFNPHDNTGTDPYGSDSNHLDDYEKGSFQPAITSVNNPQPTQTAYVHQYGYYVKIGQMVHVRVDVEFSSTGVSGGTGEALLSNLPFSCQNETNAYGITMARGYAPNWYNNGCPTGGYMNPNSNFIYLMTNSSNGSTFSQGADIGGGTRLIAGFSYISN